MKIRQASIVVLFSASTLALAGCNRDEVASYRAPKDPPKPLATTPPADLMLASSSTPADPHQPADEKRLDWTVPADWQVMPARSMRYATLALKTDPTIELAVFPLPPQPLLPNVNRWEGQLGLPPTPEAELDKVVTHLDVNSIHVEVMNLLGPVPAAGQPRMQMLAAVINEPNRSWFFKMMGPAEKVGPQKANFDAFVRSLHFVTAAAPASTTQPAPAAAAKPSARLAEWKTPAGWVQDPQPRPMRVATFNITRGNDHAEVIVSQLAKDNIGDLPGNINRWRGQVGLGPVADVNSVNAQQIALGGATGMLYDFVGPESDGPARKHMLVAMTAVGDEVWFFKMLGPQSLVAEQKPAFESFLKSTRFVGE